MADEKTKQKTEAKKAEEKVEEKKVEEVKQEQKPEAKKEEKPAVKIVKKDEAITKGNGVHASMKQSMYICSFIKGKSIDTAMADLEDVLKFKKVVPFKGEIPHRHGRIMSGRYPIVVSKIFINLLKTLKGNVIANQMDLDKARITFASATYASRAARKGGGTFKRANIILKAKEVAK
jgi:ribosomal protein L22